MKNFKNRAKKISKLVLFPIALFILGINSAQAQPTCMGTASADLAAVSVGPAQSPIGLNHVARIYVAMTNNGPCNIPIGEASVTVTLSDVYFDVAANPNFLEDCSFGLPGAGPEFTYLGDAPIPGFHVLYFSNNAGPMEINSSCYFSFEVTGKAVTPAPQTIGLASSLSPFATVSDPNGTNQSATAQVSVAIPLAVKLSDFTAEMSDCSALLKWTTAQEINSKEYQLEVSKDGRSFSPVGTVVAAGNSDNALSYSFTDKTPLDGNIFYRIKMVAKDGNVEYSKVATVNNKCNAKSVRIYPNPLVENQQFGVYISGYKGTLKGELMSMTGQLVQGFTLLNGANTLAIKGVAQGNYMLRVTETSTGANESFKVVVIK